MFKKDRGFIISQTPFRISFFGGGTDLPEYFHEHGGQVLGASVDKYMYVTINSLERFYDKRIRLSYSQLECVNHLDELKHKLCRAILGRHTSFEENEFVDIHTFADLPASSGVGSSSTFAVGMLNAMYLLHGQYKTPEQIAREAIHIERTLLKEPGGWQDQYFAAFGGFNHLIFDKNGTVRVTPVSIDKEKLNALQQSCLLIFTKATRSSAEIQKNLLQNLETKTQSFHCVKSFVDDAMDILYHTARSEDMIYEFGKLLHQAWETKRNLSSSISNSDIDALYERAIHAGAFGGKVCGAGGGGFILLMCPEAKLNAVRAAFSDHHILPIAFESRGSHPLYHKRYEFNEKNMGQPLTAEHA